MTQSDLYKKLNELLPLFEKRSELAFNLLRDNSPENYLKFYGNNNRICSKVYDICLLASKLDRKRKKK